MKNRKRKGKGKVVKSYDFETQIYFHTCFFS